MTVINLNNTAKIVAVCTSPKTGMRKKNINEGTLIEYLGFKDDAHANSSTHRQVSLLAMESIKKCRKWDLMCMKVILRKILQP